MRLFSKQQRREENPPERALDRLATFNAERERGLVHTPEYAQKMADLQERFDQGDEL